MADTKITALAAITTVDPAADVLPIVDVSDTSMAASGTTKKITSNQILGAGGTATLASATITGDLTVDTSTLKVDSANNRVGILTTTPAYALDVNGDAKVTNAVRYFVGATQYGVSFANAGVMGLESYQGTYFSIGTGAGASATERFRIANDGVCTWSNVGGVAGTAMTLNSTGLGVGLTPSGGAAGSVFSAGAVLAAGGLTANQTNRAVLGYSSNETTIRSYGATAGTGFITFRVAGGGGSGDTEAGRFDASGNLLVGTTNTNPAYNSVNGIALQPTFLSVSNTSGVAGAFNRNTDGIVLYFTRSGTAVGNVSVTTGGATFNSTSDYRLKESVAPMSGGLARVNALKPSIYKWKSDGSNGEGFIAHELAEVVPAAVNGEKDAVNEDGTIKAQSIDMSRIVPILVAAIKELTARVEALEA
jgi:hypothetical protein